MNRLTSRTSSKHQIVRRNVSIPHAAEHRYFIHDHNPVGSALFVVMSAMFPPGEMFFIESIRNFREQLTDQQLLEDVRNFIGQEAFHSREHQALNQLLAGLGYPEVHDIAEKTRQKLDNLRKLPKLRQLATTVVMEHMTASMAKTLLTDELLILKTSQEVRNLWEWHALEELEHKSVAFDVLRAVGGNTRLNRTLGLLFVIKEVGPVLFEYWIRILARKDIQFSYTELRDALYLAFGGIDRMGVLTRSFGGVIEVMFKNFDPRNMDTGDLEAQCREKLFGDNGHLKAHLKLA